MRLSVLHLGRSSCLRHSIPRQNPRQLCLPRTSPQKPASPILSQLRNTVPGKIRRKPATQNYSLIFRSSPARNTRTGVLLLAAISPLAFIELVENPSPEDASSDLTSEDRMLAISRSEIAKTVPSTTTGFTRFRLTISYYLDNYLIEPIATGFRFLHLVFIFVPVIIAIPAIWFGPRVKHRDMERRGTLWWYGFLVNGMERAGAAFIKLGQWAASRSDIFPIEMCAVMSELHSNAPAHSLAQTKRTIRKAFGGAAFEEIFEEFDEKPLGVGAIAQVYKAKLKPSLAVPTSGGDEKQMESTNATRAMLGEPPSTTQRAPPSSYVAIKVLHPTAERIVRRDLRIMGFFAAAINAIPTMEWLSLPDEVAQFGEMMRLQLDLRIEAANLVRFRKNFDKRTTAWFPYPYTSYTTREVLVEEFARGMPLSAFLENGGGVWRHELANEGLDAFLRMLLVDNFVHADLHPGNIMVSFHKKSEGRVRARFGHGATGKEETDGGGDVTEEVLRRLEPVMGKKKDWARVLEEIDSEGYRPQLILIDTGLVTELNHTNRTNFLDLFKAIADFDGYRAGHLMVERCRQPEAVIDEEVFALRMQHLVLSVKSKTFALGNIKIGEVLNEVLSMVRTHHVRMEGDFVNVVLSILLLEGIGRNLDPSLDLFKSALPILRQLGSGSGGGGVRGLARMVRDGDTSMLKVWVGLEARSYLMASVDDVERCVKYDLLSPNF